MGDSLSIDVLEDPRRGSNVRISMEAGSELERAKLDEVAHGDLNDTLEAGRRSYGRSIRWGKAQGKMGFGRNEFVSGSYGTFVDTSRISEDETFGVLLLRDYWKWIALFAVLVIMVFANWYGLGLGGEFVLYLGYQERAWTGIIESKITC